MVGLLKRGWRQYFSAAHREGLHKLKHLEEQTQTIADRLQAGEDLDQHDRWRLEELKYKLVAFPKWLTAEWLLADRGYQIEELQTLIEGLEKKLDQLNQWLSDQGDDGLDEQEVRVDKKMLRDLQEKILGIEEWLQEERGYTAQLSKVLEKEKEKIHQRRKRVAREFEEGALTADAERLLELSPDERPPVGLAFSGGGIRSATFNLGLVQGLAKYRILPWVDYLTSVSGGGFTAACMTTLLSLREDSKYHFNTQWERFPFNPELEVFDYEGVAEERKDAGKASGSGQPALKRGRNRQLVYLRDRGNWLVPRMGWATRDVLRGVGGFLLRPTYTVLVFLLALLAMAAFHYGLNAALTPSIMQNIELHTLDKVVLVPPQPHLWTTLGAGIAFALLSGFVLRKLYSNDPTIKGKLRPWKSRDYKLQTRTYLTLAGVRMFAGVGFLLLFLLTCWLCVGQYQALLPEFRSPFSLPLLQVRQLAESQNALPHFFWAWTALFIVFTAAASWFLLRYSKDDTWVEMGLPEQLRIDTLVIYALAGLGLWAATLLLFWLRLRSFGAGDASPQIFWIWLPAVFTLGSLLGLLLFRVFPLRQYVYAEPGKRYEDSLGQFGKWWKWWFDQVLDKSGQSEKAREDFQPYHLSIWSSPEFRSIISTLQGLALYGLIAFAVLALLLLPHSLSVETGTGPRTVVPLATLILSSAWAAVLTYAKDKASFQATNLVTKIAVPSGTLGNYLLGLLVILLNLSLIFIMQSVIDSRATWHPYCIGGLALLLLCIVGRYFNFNYLSPHLLYSDRIAEVCLKTDVERDGLAKVVRDERQERLWWITPARCSAPYHIVQTTLNLPGTWRLKPKDRKSEPFIFSKWYCGSDMTGYVRNDRPGLYRGCMTLYGKAIGLSGAAVSSGLGFRTFFAQAFMTTFLNVRLGLWLTNPRLYKLGVPRQTARPHDAETTAFWPLYLWDEARAQISERRDLINLTDGEHTGDGIGLYPLFQRRCKFIIAGDAGGDPAGTGRGLFTVLRQVKDDLGIEVDIDVEGTKPEQYDPEKKVAKPSKRHFAVGTIKYPATFNDQGNPVLPEQDGWLIYFKPAVTEEDPGAIRAYWNRYKMEFPVPSTADQLFEEEQWEMQRWVGEITVEYTLRALKSHYEEKVKGGGNQADRDKLKFLQELLASQRIDFELLAKDKYPALLEEFLQLLYDISNDATAKAQAEETPAEGKASATRKVHRDAKTGRFVTKQYTKEHPDTTVTETVE